MDNGVFGPHLRGIERALAQAGDTHSVEDVLGLIEENQAQLWVTEKAAIVTEVVQHPRKRILHFWLAAGNLDGVVELSRAAMDWGKRIGCDYATLTGREGWSRVYKDEGWETAQVMMRRGL